MQNTVTPTDVLECVISGDFHDPFSVLGMHRESGRLFVRTLLPGAVSVSVVDAHSGKELVRMERFADTALFDAEIPGFLIIGVNAVFFILGVVHIEKMPDSKK